MVFNWFQWPNAPSEWREIESLKDNYRAIRGDGERIGCNSFSQLTTAQSRSRQHLREPEFWLDFDIFSGWTRAGSSKNHFPVLFFLAQLISSGISIFLALDDDGCFVLLCFVSARADSVKRFRPARRTVIWCLYQKLLNLALLKPKLSNK